ncbi:MAG: sigma-70 family RNA polymerase sigma factor [Clostridiales bacterium]|nr:sigma-70 family RNA polymerase sigma factor [Clostridiales bacterium]
MDHGAEYYRRYLDRDDTGLKLLIDEYTDGLILYLNTVIHDLAAAEDIAEDCFVRLAVKKPRYNGKASFKTWLYTIARRMAIDELRRRARHPHTPLEDVENTLAQEEKLLRSDEKLAIYQAMRRLSDPHRQILWLIYFEDQSTAQAAEIMGISPSAASSLLHRAKQTMKNELERGGSDENP